MLKKKIVLNLIIFIFAALITVLISYITKDRLISPLRLGYFGIICYRIFISYCLYLLIMRICFSAITLLQKKIFLFIYIALVIGLLLSRDNGISSINFQIGRIDDYSALTFIGNLFMFLPVSYLVRQLFRIKTKHIILIILISIIILEVLQYVLSKGCLDINDIILNMFGCLFGIILFIVLNDRKKRKIIT